MSRLQEYFPPQKRADMLKQNFRILLTDDADNDRRLVKLALEDLGYPPEILLQFSSGEELLAFLEKEDEKRKTESVILLDLNMPKLDGKATLRKIKEKKLSCVPVVIYSTSANDVDVRECYALGSAAYIVKPESIEGIEKAFKSLIEFYSQTRIVEC